MSLRNVFPFPGFNSGYGSLIDIVNSADVAIHGNYPQFNKIYLVTHPAQIL